MRSQEEFYPSAGWLAGYMYILIFESKRVTRHKITIEDFQRFTFK